MPRKGNKKIVEVVHEAVVSSRTARNRRRRQRLKERLAGARVAGVEGEMEALALAGVGVNHRKAGLGRELSARMDEFGSASTHDGATWLTKFLDPCHPTEAVLGIPDTVSANVTSPQYTTVDTLEYNPPTTPGVTTTWNFVEIVDFSTGSVFRLQYESAVADITTANARVYTFQLPGATEVFKGEGYASSRQTYAGVTYDFSGASLTDQGRQVAVQLTPEWKKAVVENDLNTGHEGITTYVWPWGNGATLGTNLVGLNFFLKNLAESDPKSYSDAAKRGAYFPIRNTNPFRFKDHSASTVGLAGNQAPTTRFENPLSIVTGLSLSGTNLAPFTALVEPWDMCASVYWVTGIDKSSTFQRTVRYGFEVMIEPDSPFRPYAHVSPCYDRRAMECATDIGTTLASAYPAEYNFLGKLWKGIKKVAGGVGKVFSVGKPIYNAVGPALGLPALPF